MLFYSKNVKFTKNLVVLDFTKNKGFITVISLNRRIDAIEIALFIDITLKI